jgi:hypothetical protein
VKITAAEAREYFAHESQRRGNMIDPADLPETGVEYWARDGVCGMFHRSFWPDVWMVHHAVKPEAWGRADAPAKAILRAFWTEKKPRRIIGWTLEGNRAAVAFARRVGFAVDGKMELPSGPVLMQGWSG